MADIGRRRDIVALLGIVMVPTGRQADCVGQRLIAAWNIVSGSRLGQKIGVGQFFKARQFPDIRQIDRLRADIQRSGQHAKTEQRDKQDRETMPERP